MMYNKDALQDLTYTRLVATPAGMELLASNSEIHQTVADFCRATDEAEQTLERPDLTVIGVGRNARVYRVSDSFVALKVSTPVTARNTNDMPENMIGQTLYMQRLQDELRQKTDGTVLVPQQYFALQTPAGNYIQAQQYMDGWESLAGRSVRLGINRQAVEALQAATKVRLSRALGRTSLLSAIGANDLGLKPRDSLNSGNVLLPKDAVDAYTASLCIIDQPKKSLQGSLAGYAADVLLHMPGCQSSIIDIRR